MRAAWTRAAAAAIALLAIAHPHAQDRGSILFVGSSIFHRWTQLASQMAPLPITNIAFDGAVTEDWNRLVDARVIPVRPAIVVYYCGSNDVDAGDSAARITARIKQFIDRVLGALPDTRIVFVSVNKAPEKRDRWDVVDDINRRVQALAVRDSRVLFVDVNPALVAPDGTPRIERFMNDRLHLRPAAYEEIATILKPVLTAAIARR